jgi:hypothetical protein
VETYGERYKLDPSPKGWSEQFPGKKWSVPDYHRFPLFVLLEPQTRWSPQWT